MAVKFFLRLRHTLASRTAAVADHPVRQFSESDRHTRSQSPGRLLSSMLSKVFGARIFKVYVYDRCISPSFWDPRRTCRNFCFVSKNSLTPTRRMLEAYFSSLLVLLFLYVLTSIERRVRGSRSNLSHSSPKFCATGVSKRCTAPPVTDVRRTKQAVSIQASA